MKAILIAILALIITLPLMAGFDLPKPDFNPYNTGGYSLLNPDRLSMSHSLGFYAGASSSGQGFYLSRYTNQLKYTFNPKLDLELDLNFVNYGSAGSSFKLNDDNRSHILPEFKLNYRPSDNVQLQIEFRQANPWLDSGTPWYERW